MQHFIGDLRDGAIRESLVRPKGIRDCCAERAFNESHRGILWKQLKPVVYFDEPAALFGFFFGGGWMWPLSTSWTTSARIAGSADFRT